MDAKLTLLLLLAAAAQTCLAQNTSESCLESTTTTTTIKSGLATIDFGQESSLTGLRNMEDAIYHEIISILADRSSGQDVDSGSTEERFELAKTTAYDSLMLGIEPTLLAIKVFQPDTDVPGLMATTTTICEEFIDIVFSIINVTRVSENYTASQAELATHAEDLNLQGAKMIQGLYGSLFEGSTPIPEESVTVMACIGQKAKGYVLGAMANIADQAAVALAAIHNIGTEDALERITAIHQQARSDFDTEVLWKYSLIRNLVVGAYLQNSTDIVTGLFDILSIVPGYTDI